MIQEQAKKYYADHAFFGNDRAFAERHFCEGAEWMMHRAYHALEKILSKECLEEFRKAMEE